MPDKRQTFGQFETPPDVADLLLAFCLHSSSDRVLDPSCGSGSLLRRAAQWQSGLAESGGNGHRHLWGVELETEAAAAARQMLPEAKILHQNFFTLEPEQPFDAIVGNPPYTRAEWIDSLQQKVGRQMVMFDSAPQRASPKKRSLIPSYLWNSGLSRRAGLHSYFFLHGARFLREGGRFGFVVPNNWLDVGYGEALKQFLLEQFKITALIESTVERWFEDARVNTCLVILEKCRDAEERAAHPVRFVQLREPLDELIQLSPCHAGRFDEVAQLAARLLPQQDRTDAAMRVRVILQGSLQAGEKWGMYWRAPALVHQLRRRAGQRQVAPLRRWARVRRGYTTGANAFFYLDQKTISDWNIEPQFRQPLLKSLRNVDCLAVDRAACEQEVLVIPAGDELAGTAAGEYVAWGQSQGYHRRSTCRQRQPWYALPLQEPAELLLPKGIWGRYLAPLVEGAVFVDQQLYLVHLESGIPRPAAAALLNSAWLALQLELYGRVNFGEGVLWLAAYEVANLLLPDPRYLKPADIRQLAELFEAVCALPASSDLPAELQRPERQALDQAVFELMGLSHTESVVVLDTLLERVSARQAQAASVS